jgi:hypothetical protein
MDLGPGRHGVSISLTDRHAEKRGWRVVRREGDASGQLLMGRNRIRATCELSRCVRSRAGPIGRGPRSGPPARRRRSVRSARPGHRRRHMSGPHRPALYGGVPAVRLVQIGQGSINCTPGYPQAWLRTPYLSPFVLSLEPTCIAHGPTRPAARSCGQRAPRALSDNLYEEVFAAMRTNRDRAIVATAVSAGLRASGLLSIRCGMLHAGGPDSRRHSEGR